MKNTKSKINVILTTYNHEDFISQAIESILMQHFKGEVEIIIADDCSTDNTINIIKFFDDQSKFKFRYLNNSHNLGIKKNYQKAFAACDGDYIAVLEGDDYWCNPYRLQKHVDFLEEHRECVMSWNPYIEFNEDTKLFETPSINPCAIKYISFSDLLLSNRVGNYSSCVYRKSSYDKINPDLYDVDVEVPDEWLLGLELTKYGFAALLTDCMTVYRKNTGVWGKLTEQQMYEKYIHRIKVYDEYFNFQYTELFKVHKNRLKKELHSKKDAELRSKLPPIFYYLKNLPSTIGLILKKIVLFFVPFNFKRYLKTRLNIL